MVISVSNVKELWSPQNSSGADGVSWLPGWCCLGAASAGISIPKGNEKVFQPPTFQILCWFWGGYRPWDWCISYTSDPYRISNRPYIDVQESSWSVIKSTRVPGWLMFGSSTSTRQWENHRNSPLIYQAGFSWMPMEFSISNSDSGWQVRQVYDVIRSNSLAHKQMIFESFPTRPN